MTTIPGRVLELVTERPDDIFLVLRRRGVETSFTFSDLWKGATSYADALERKGVGQGGVCVIMLDHTEHLYYAFLGAMLYGAVPSFMPYCTPKQDPDLFWRGHKKLFERIQPTCLITFEDNLDQAASAIHDECPIIVPAELTSDAVGGRSPATNPDDVAFLQHSSGTTGLKKGVMLTHRAVFAQLASYAPAIEFTENAVIASWLPVYHDMGLIACLLMPMVVGARVVHLDSIEWVSRPLDLLDAVQHHRATHVWLPNFAFNHLAASRRRAGPWDLSSLKVISNCSEPCKVESMEAFVEVFADCGVRPEVPQVCYAMAETVFAITQTPVGRKVDGLEVSRRAMAEDHYAKAPIDAADGRFIPSCGVPIEGMEVRILAEGRDASDGQIGEVCARGTSLFSGYYRLPDVTDQKLKESWLRTGDLGFVRDGRLFVTGRMDDLMIVRGRNFYAHEVEAVINQVREVHPGRVVAFTVDNPALGTSEAVALAEPSQGADLSNLRRSVRSAVEDASGLVLARVHFVQPGTLVKTTSGKISRESNKVRYLDGSLNLMEI